LAAVLAHEITHVSQHHWSRTMAAQKERSGLTAAALLASVILAGSGQTVGEAGIALTTAIELQQQLSFSREFEREADRIGIQLLASSGFDPEAMGRFFEKLQASNRLSESGPEYLRTHPITSNRLAEAYDRARRLNGQKSAINSADFDHAQARILALYAESPKQALAALDSLFKNKSDAAYLYGRAITLMRARNFNGASRLASSLQHQHPDQVRYRMLEADILVQSKKLGQGLKIYESIYRKFPDKKEIVMRYAAVLISNSQFDAAYRLLGPRRSYPATDPQLQRMFARAAGETGHLVESHRAMADYYYLSGNLPLGIEQLRIARRLAEKDAYSRAGIDAQLKEFESEKSE
jgi:predicted Zn-dependent protease